MLSIISTIIYFFIFLAVLFAGLYLLKKYRHLKRNGVAAKGYIYGRGKWGSYMYVRFITQQETWIIGKSYIKGVYEEGDTFNIYYNPANPEDFVISNKQTKATIFSLIGISIFMLFFGIFMIVASGHLLPWGHVY